MPFLTCFIVLALVASSLGAQDRPDRYIAVVNGEPVGYLHVIRTGTRVKVNFVIDDNGRGPKIRETWDLRPDGLPRRLTLTGTTTFGSRAEESFRWTENRAEWRTLNDRDSATITEPGTYVPVEGSPYYLAIYLPALLRAAGQTLPTWPSGSLRAERLRDISLGHSRKTVTVWGIWGLDLNPFYVMADPEGGHRSTALHLAPSV